jgi:hypothetical protein
VDAVQRLASNAQTPSSSRMPSKNLQRHKISLDGINL